MFEVRGHRIHALELVTYDRRKGRFLAWVFSDGVNEPLEYRWIVRGDRVEHSGLGATFRGRFRDRGETLAGGWRPDREGVGGTGASYDAVMTRLPATRT